MRLNKIIQIFKIREIRNKILFVLLIFAVFRIMATIPIPGIDKIKMQQFFEGIQIFGLLNIFTGGALDRLSIIMLGLGPYITATIILQLLTMIFPRLEEIYREQGEVGRRKFNQYGRILAAPLAMLQGYAMLSLLQRQNVIESLSLVEQLSSILTITAGTIFLMWLGELISEKGIGNGVSLLIFAGIVSDVPTNIRQMILYWNPAQILSYTLFFFIALLVIGGVVLINEASRNIKISYSKRVRGRRVYGGASTYLPLNINPAGVMPIIFALSLLSFPSMIGTFLLGVKNQTLANLAQMTIDLLQNPWIYGILYFVLICLFTYFYTAVTFDPNTIAENLRKMGGFIPGVRPGKPTASFLSIVLNRILLVGALFLGFIATTPSIVGGITKVPTFNFLVGGTSLLIVVSVVLEIVKQIKSQLEMREYDAF